MSVRSLLKINKGNEIHLWSLKAIFVKVSQNFIKSHLKFCLISQISAHSLWDVWYRRAKQVSETFREDPEQCFILYPERLPYRNTCSQLSMIISYSNKNIQTIDKHKQIPLSELIPSQKYML